MYPGEQIIERVIFEGVLQESDSLEIAISGLEEDFFDLPDSFERYLRRFQGNPNDWAGSYQPGDEARDPEAKADWQVWYRIEVSPAGVDVRPPTDWGQVLFHEEFIEERTDVSGRFDPEMWIKAREHKRQMRRPIPQEDDPGGTAPDGEDRASLIGSDGQEIPLNMTTHPAPGSAFADPNRVVHVPGEGHMGEAALKIGVAVDELTGINPATLRIFKWDPRRGGFRLITRSGLGGDGTYVWAKVNSPGAYAVFGLPSDRARLDTARIACLLKPWGKFSSTLPSGNRPFIDRICQLILCADMFEDQLQDIEILEEMGLGDVIGRDLAVYGDMVLDAKGKPVGPRPLLKPGPGRFGNGAPGEPGPSDAPLPPTGGPGTRSFGGDLCEQCFGAVGGILGRPDGVENQIFDDPGIFELPDPPIRATCTSWTSLGPTNLGGRVKSMAFHPTSPNIVYAGNSQGGVFKSANGGASWWPLMSGELVLAIGAIAVAPSAPNVIFAGTGEYGGWYQQGVGIYKSTDGGNDWDLMNATSNNRFSKIVIHPTDPQRVYASGNAGVERSVDGGVTWTLILTGQVSDILLDPTDPTALYAGCEDNRGVQRTNNAQAAVVNWNPMNNGLTLVTNHSTNPWNNYLKLAATVDSGGDTVLWCQLNSLPDPWTGADPPTWTSYGITVYKWTGSAWDDRGTPGGTSYSDWCSVIAVEPGSPDVVYSGRNGAYWTPDGGTNWYTLGTGHADNHAIIFDPTNPLRTLAGNDGGIYKHTRTVNADGSPAETNISYTDSNTGHVTIQLENISVSQLGSFGIGGATQDQGVLVNHVGSDWDGIGGAEWGALDVYARDGDIIMWDPKYDQSLPLQRTENGGTLKRNANNGLGGRWVNEIAMHPTNSLLVLAATKSQTVGGAAQTAAIFRSADGGAALPATGFTSVQQFTGNVNDITFSPSNPNRVYAVTANGQLWSSADAGVNWGQVGNGPLGGLGIASVTVDWGDPDLIYVTYKNTGVRHVHVSDDGGATWDDISGALPHTSLPDIPVHRLMVDNRFSETLYAATDIGVFRTTDGGDWWYPFDEGLPNAIVNDIDYRPSSQKLYVSTFGRGAYSRLI
jgi:hypothetical protein